MGVKKVKTNTYSGHVLGCSSECGKWIGKWECASLDHEALSPRGPGTQLDCPTSEGVTNMRELLFASAWQGFPEKKDLLFPGLTLEIRNQQMYTWRSNLAHCLSCK